MVHWGYVHQSNGIKSYVWKCTTYQAVVRASSVGKFLKFGFCLQGYANFASYNMILHMLIGTTKHWLLIHIDS